MWVFVWNTITMNTPLKRLLFEREKTNRWLAQQIGMADSPVSEIVSGKRVPTLPIAIKIARALEVSVEDLWGWTVDQNKPD